ncbi:MAG: ribonuclease III [Thermovirgaceae bacterium]
MAENREVFGYTFSDSRFLEEALTHASFANEQGLGYTNERLEFLGDAVLQLAVTHYLYESYPDDNEGELSRKRAALVCEQTLAEWAIETGLGSRIRLGKGLSRSGGSENPSVLADAVEAVIGALFLDGGFEKVLGIIFQFSRSRKQRLLQGEENPKALLQERFESQGKGRPTYRLVKTEGPAHKPIHTVEILLDGKALARATGKTVREAESKAAEEILARI